MNFRLQKDLEIKQKIEEERKKMFKPTIDTNSCRLAAKTEGVLEKAMVKQRVDQTHLVDYFKAEEVMEDKKSSKLKGSNGKQQSPRSKKQGEKQNRLPGAKQEFDNVRSKYMDALLTPRKKQFESPVSKAPEGPGSGKPVLQAKQAAGVRKPAPQKKESPKTAAGKKPPTEERASRRSKSSGREYSNSAGRQLQRSPERVKPDPLLGMKGQQIYHSSNYFSSMNEQTPVTTLQSQSNRQKPGPPKPRLSSYKEQGPPSPRPKAIVSSPQALGNLIAQGSDEEIEIMIQDEDRSPSPKERPAAPRQSALEAKRVKT